MVEFKDEMLMGLYNAKLKKTCLFFMPEELQHENKIKTVLDSQLKTTHMDSIETVENSKRVDKMCEIGNSNREPVSCDNLGKEEQVSHGCKNERQDTGWTTELRRRKWWIQEGYSKDNQEDSIIYGSFSKEFWHLRSGNPGIEWC